MEFFQNWETEGLLLLGKLFLAGFSVIYTLFAFIVVRQVNLMNRSFRTSLHSFFTFVAWAHFFAALLGVAMVVLLL